MHDLLVGMEFSGVIREAFRNRGYDAVSCDLLPSEQPGPHIQGDLRDVNFTEYHMAILHPPCTYTAVSGNRWYGRGTDGEALREQGLAFVQWCMNVDIPLLAIEHPISVVSTRIVKPLQIIQPWEYGHGETKATCLWLRGLPLLQPTNIVSGREARVWKETPSADRWRNRSRTLEGIANAMAVQWGPIIEQNKRSS